METREIDPVGLTAEFNEDALKRISAEIIRAYKNRQWGILGRYAEKLGLVPADFEGRRSRMFQKIILFYHPDRRLLIHEKIARLHRERNWAALERLSACLHPAIDTGKRREEAFSYEEGSVFDFADFFGGTEDFSSYWEGAPLSEYEEEHSGFIEAVKRMMYGNMTDEFLPKDLLYLEGALELSSEGIEDLSGIEYCRNIRSLGLADNRIVHTGALSSLLNLEVLDLSDNDVSDTEPLAALKGLRSLDLSFNEVEDAAPLARLPDLAYLNLAGNPLRDSPELRELGARCLLVTG